MILFTGYIIIVAISALAQNRMLYFPDTAPPSPGNLRPAYGPALAVWPIAEVSSHRGYVSAEPAADLPSRGTVVVFHGNAGSARDRHYYITALESRGYRALLAEYPGYGGRDGKLGEAPFVADGRETARLALAEFGGPLWVWGESLGAGVAAGVAADETLPVEGVVLITPWHNLPDLAQALYWFLPARHLIRDKYDNQENLKKYPGPVAVLIAENDEIIPPEHGRRLYEALPEPRRQWIFSSAGHNNWPIEPSAPWWGEVSDWLEEKSAHPITCAPSSSRTGSAR